MVEAPAFFIDLVSLASSGEDGNFGFLVPQCMKRGPTTSFQHLRARRISGLLPDERRITEWYQILGYIHSNQSDFFGLWQRNDVTFHRG